jgi:hypothetical protein
MLCSALPDLDVLVERARQWGRGGGVRTVTTTVVVDGMKTVRTVVEPPVR